jgi:antitoxin ParD1/3/4
MPSSVELGNLEKSVEWLIQSGRYHSKSEVLREGVRLVEEREKRLAELNAAIEEGLASARSGKLIPADEVFDRLITKYENLAKERGY